MENENDKKLESIYSKRLRAGKRRTYFFDIRSTKGNDYYLTITESRKRFDDNGYDRHKVFLYKEDFNKFLKSLNDAIDFVKTDLMPDFDFDSFSHEDNEWNEGDNNYVAASTTETIVAVAEPAPVQIVEQVQEETSNPNTHHEEVDKW